MCVLLVISPCGISESLDGGIPTSDSDHSGSRLHCLLLCSLNLNLTLPLLLPPDVRPRDQPNPPQPPHPSTSTLTLHGIICPPGHTLSLSQYTKKNLVPHGVLRSPKCHHSLLTSPAPPSPVSLRVYLLVPYLSPTTPARFLSPSLPRCFQNLL